MKTTSEILNLLKSYKNIATAKYGLPKIGIFGSVARGEQTDESDVDVCYEGKAPSFLTLDLGKPTWKSYLEPRSIWLG